MTRVYGHGPRNAKIMVVGEAPAKTEVRHKERTGEDRPFIGRAGDEFDRILEVVGVSRSEMYITNAMLEQVPGEKAAKDRAFFTKGYPTPTFLDGLKRLYADIQEIKPNVVVPLGNYALWALCQHQQIMKYRGSILWSELGNVKVVPTIHPAALLYGDKSGGEQFAGMYKYRPIMILDLIRAKHQSHFPQRKLKDRNVWILDSPYDRLTEEAVERLRKAQEIIWDIETFGRLNLACVGMSDGDPNWAACFIYNNDPGMMAIYKLLLESDIPKSGQNLMFDCTAMDQLGCHAKAIEYDTMIGQHIVMPDLPKGLDFQCSINTDIPYYKDEGKAWKKKEITDLKTFWLYNGKDVCGTTESKIVQLDEIGGDEAYRRMLDLEMSQFEPLRGVTGRGWKVNPQVLIDHEKEARIHREQLQRELDDAAKYDFNPRSHIQVKELVFTIRGHESRTRRNKQTGESTLTSKAEVLIDISAKTGDLVPYMITKIREVDKSLGTYYTTKNISPDGRIRSSYNIAGTWIGGRVSSSRPLWGPGINQQNVPDNTRDAFIPDDGYEMGHWDQAQAEAVIVAYLALDPIHIDCFRTGKDVHRVTGCLLLDQPTANWQQIGKSDKIRALAKECNHALNYDMGYMTLMYRVNSRWDPKDSTSLKLDARTAEALWNKYREIRPALESYWNWVRNELRNNNMCLYSPLGFKHEFLDKWSDTLFKKAYAWIPQRTVGDITSIGIRRIHADEELMRAGVQLLTQTHDSTDWQWPIGVRDFVVPRIFKHLEVDLNVNGHHIVIPVEGGMGPHWAASSDNSHPEHISLGKSRETCEVM